MVSEGSRDTEDGWKFSFAFSGIHFIFKYIQKENIDFE